MEQFAGSDDGYNLITESDVFSFYSSNAK